MVYTGDMFQAKLRLMAGESTELHPFLLKPRNMKPLEFDMPVEATRAGTLDLSWHAEPGRGGNGRGCQVVGGVADQERQMTDPPLASDEFIRQDRDHAGQVR